MTPPRPLRRQSTTSPSAPPSGSPATVATIDLNALAHNLALVRHRIPAGCQVIAVVKADAYGHGMLAIARALTRLGVHRLGVSTTSEGIALRRARVKSPILVMGAIQPGELREAVAWDLTPVICQVEQLAVLAGSVQRRSKPYPVHLKIDTGMGRLGFAVDELAAALESPACHRSVKIEGLMTHLADADNPDPTFTNLQLDRFHSVVKRVEATGRQVPLIHAANSAAILRHPAAHLTAVRPGIMLYGYHTLSGGVPGPSLQPVLALTTKVAQVRALGKGESVSYNCTFVTRRPSRVAVLPVGYADGYSRGLSNRGEVLVGGQRAPIVGRVCMDLTIVDVTDIPGVGPGSEAVLIGAQGDARITASDVAAWQGTIPYEVLSAIGPRVPRILLPMDSRSVARERPRTGPERNEVGGEFRS